MRKPRLLTGAELFVSKGHLHRWLFLNKPWHKSSCLASRKAHRVSMVVEWVFLLPGVDGPQELRRRWLHYLQRGFLRNFYITLLVLSCDRFGTVLAITPRYLSWALLNLLRNLTKWNRERTDSIERCNLLFRNLWWLPRDIAVNPIVQRS
jgi:hypothetical protein